MAKDAFGSKTISLDDLVSTASRSTLKTFREFAPGLKVPPKIWVGIWIDPTEMLKDLQADVRKQ